MNRSLLKPFRKFADQANLSLDEKSGIIYGKKQGYDVYISQVNQLKAFHITFFIKSSEMLPKSSEMNEIVEDNKKYLKHCEVTGYMVKFQTKLGAGFGYNNAINKAMNALDIIITSLRHKDFENTCQACGTTHDLESYILDSAAPAQMCHTCYNNYCQSNEVKKQAEKQKRENIIGGVTGAFIGTLLGSVCIILLGQIGYVASISGLVMSVCALKGYELLGGKLTKKGIVASSVLIIAMVYLSHRVDYAITIANYFNVDVITSFHSIPDLLAEAIIDSTSYYTNLGMVYVFTLIGAVPTISNTLKNQNASNSNYRLNM